MIVARWFGLLLALWISVKSAAADEGPLKPAFASLQGERILEHIKVLASDKFEGRGPGTPGEEKTVAYLTEQFRALGLAPGNPNGTYIQDVPLVGFQAKTVAGSFQIKGQTLPLAFPTDLVALSRRSAQEVKVENSDVVFVGYGVVAPEYGWDDFKGLDARGKTLVMLVNDPPVPDPKDPAKLDPTMFKGKAMTYYGRWTYKYEIASEKGAEAVILIHETGPAGYPFSVVQGSWSRENFDIASNPTDAKPKRVAVEGWISLDKTKELLKATGHDFDGLKKQALSRDFRPVPLNAKAQFSINNALRDVKSRNVIAKLEGSDPKLKNDTIVYTAHWDHLGTDPALKGDQIFNGAADNASGVATVLEIARAFTKIQPVPKRSILFLAVTAEEKGLLGAKYYTSHPLYPLDRTLADINLDVVNLLGKTSDVISIGMGQSTLDDLFVAAAQTQGRTVIPDAEPEKGYYFRSDHFEFAKQGVPALDPKGGMSYLNRPADFGKRKHDEYTEKDYHKVSDEVKPDWDLSGAVEDAKLAIEVGYKVSEGDKIPDWKPDSEFRSKRARPAKP